MNERLQPPQPEDEPPVIPSYRMNSWEEANELLDQLTQDGTRAMGSWYRYPEDYTFVYKDALSGQGMGYWVWRNENGKHVELMADISIGKLPEEVEEP